MGGEPAAIGAWEVCLFRATTCSCFSENLLERAGIFTCLPCKDSIGTGPPRARREVIYEDLGYSVFRCHRPMAAVCFESLSYRSKLSHRSKCTRECSKEGNTQMHTSPHALGTRQPSLPRGGVHQKVAGLSHRIYLLLSFRKSTPPQNRQLIIYYNN